MAYDPKKLQRQRRLQAIDAAHRSAMRSLNSEFNRTYDAALRKHGLTITKLSDHLTFPLEFHEDIAEAKKTFLAGHSLARQAKQSSARSLPRRV